MKANPAAAACLVLALAWTSGGYGQEALVDGRDVSGVVQAARAYGSAAAGAQPNGDPMISGRIDGLPYSVRFHNCVEDNACGDVNFRIGFEVKPELETINAWNRSKRFTRAYTDQAGDAILEMDAVLRGGVSPANMREVFAYWRIAIKQFAKHVGFES